MSDTSRTYETWWAHAVTQGEGRPTDPLLPPNRRWCGEWFPFGVTEAGCHWRRPALGPEVLTMKGEKLYIQDECYGEWL